MSNCPVASCTSQLDVPLEDLGISHCEAAAYLRVLSSSMSLICAHDQLVVWLRLSSIYLACLTFRLFTLKTAGGGDLRTHPPHLREVLRSEHLSMLVAISLHLEL